MDSRLNLLIAQEHTADMRTGARAARRRARAEVVPAVPAPEVIALRIADDHDAGDVRRLAALDDARPLRGTVLLALRDGSPIAALSLADDRVVATPMQRTADAVALLRVRAAHLRGEAPAPRARLARLRFRAA